MAELISLLKPIGDYISDHLSEILSLVTLVVAFLTLRSQKHTERNTMPIINNDVQKMLFEDLIIRLLDAQMHIAAGWNVSFEKKYDFYISERILNNIRIPLDLIHVELFYNDPIDYKTVSVLYYSVKEYNEYVDVLEEHMKNKVIDKNLLHKEFDMLSKMNDNIAQTWSKVMTIIYKYNDEKKSDLFLNQIIENKNIIVDEENTHTYYSDDDVYIKFLTDKEQRKKMRAYMDKETEKRINIFRNNLIRKKR